MWGLAQPMLGAREFRPRPSTIPPIEVPTEDFDIILGSGDCANATRPALIRLRRTSSHIGRMQLCYETPLGRLNAYEPKFDEAVWHGMISVAVGPLMTSSRSGTTEDLGPVVLDGNFVRLEPLRAKHRDGLLAAAQFPEIWSWMPVNLMALESLDRWIEDAEEQEARREAYPFAVLAKDSWRIIGSTRYLEVRVEHRGVEIGWTWYSADSWGTAVNPECKLLLLRHAFEDWGAIRVQLKTDGMNVHSQAAISKLGAKLEGTLRKHRIRPDGTVRDTMVYSITDEEWPEVRARLMQRLGRQAGHRAEGEP